MTGATMYDVHQLAASMRAVRQNTILIAEDVPESSYGFRATPGTRSVAEKRWFTSHGSGAPTA